MNSKPDKIIKAEIRKIEIDKWDEGVRRKNDPGDAFVMDWIKNNGPKFRKLWDNSKCKTCMNSDECGYKVEQICYRYEEDKNGDRKS